MLKNKLAFFILLPGFFILTTCKKVEKVMMVTTGIVSDTTFNSAKISGQIIDIGEGATQHGHYYSTTANETIPGSKTEKGIPSGTGEFTSQLTGLVEGTKYYVKAYVSNGTVTVYGKEISFSTFSRTLPLAPTIGTATAANGQATVTFTAPANNGGPPITGYKVTSNPGGIAANGSSSPITVTGLTNGTAYTFTVTATNANGTGPASSASNSVTPGPVSTVPGAPTGVSATKGNGQATVTFTAPVSNGGSVITGYTVTSNPGGFTGTGSASPVTVTGLTNGTAYTFTVTATNANGTGPASSASNSVTPSTVPGAPTGVSAAKGNGQATVTFTAPVSTGGSPITGYTVTSNPGGFTANGSASPVTVTGLINGTPYTFTVTAANVNGTGPASSASNSVTPSNSSFVYDADNNAYNTVTIGSQVWLAQNLKTTRYSNGDLIGTTNPSTLDITYEVSPKYQWAAGNNESNVATYGRLYTWFVATDIRNVCPSGWHVPSDTEWQTLKTYLGGSLVAGGKVKETGTLHWQTPNTGATNETGFTAVPAGYRFINGSFFSLTVTCYFWSINQDPSVSEYGLGQGLHYNDNILGQGGHEKIDGMTIRCLKN